MNIKLSNDSSNKKHTFVDLNIDLTHRIIGNDNKNNSNTIGNDIIVDTDENAILNSIKNRIIQRRYMNPKFFVNAKKFIGEPIIDMNATSLGDEIDRALKSDPRYNVDNISVIPDKENNMYNIIINITLVNLNKNLSMGAIWTPDGNINFAS